MEEQNQIDTLMTNLAKDLVELESIEIKEPVLELITETYENIYRELSEIKRN